MLTRKNNAFSMRRTMRGVIKKVNCFHKDLVLANHNTTLALPNQPISLLLRFTPVYPTYPARVRVYLSRERTCWDACGSNCAQSVQGLDR